MRAASSSSSMARRRSPACQRCLPVATERRGATGGAGVGSFASVGIGARPGRRWVSLSRSAGRGGAWWRRLPAWCRRNGTCCGRHGRPAAAQPLRRSRRTHRMGHGAVCARRVGHRPVAERRSAPGRGPGEAAESRLQTFRDDRRDGGRDGGKPGDHDRQGDRDGDHPDESGEGVAADDEPPDTHRRAARLQVTSDPGEQADDECDREQDCSDRESHHAPPVAYGTPWPCSSMTDR